MYGERSKRFEFNRKIGCEVAWMTLSRSGESAVLFTELYDPCWLNGGNITKRVSVLSLNTKRYYTTHDLPMLRSYQSGYFEKIGLI